MDSSSSQTNGSGENRSNRRPFRMGRGGRRITPSPPTQASGSSPASYMSLARLFQRSSPAPETSQTPSPPSSTRSPSPNLPTATPIHTREMTVNPQNASPLYNGRFPPEIRNQIFQYALTEYTKSDKDSQYPKNTNYTRPGYSGKRAVTISLLLTSRQTYLETYHLPAQNKEHVFWHARWPPSHERYNNRAGEQESAYFNLFAPWQLELVKEIHLFTQLFWLEDGVFFKLTGEDFMQGIQKLKITVRRGDWWWNERNAPLAINPKRGNGDAAQMHRDWDLERRGQINPWKEGGWGTAFGNLRSLKELEMEFETSEDKVVELEEIVEYAKTWRFPLKDGKVLSQEGLQEKWKWRAPMCYWSPQCPYCHGAPNCRSRKLMKEQCIEKKRLKELDLGPECTVVSLRWRVVDGET